MDNQAGSKKETPKTTQPTNGTMMVLGKQNYYLMLAGLAVIILGFILMSGGKSEDPNVFNAAEVYSNRRIVVAPIVVILGFAIEIYAVFHKSKK